MALEAHHTLWAILLDMGELSSTKDHAEQGFLLYDRRLNGQLELNGGQDRSCARDFTGEGRIGYRLRIEFAYDEAAVPMATELRHPYTSWLVLLAAVWIHHHRGDRQAAQDRVENAAGACDGA